MLGANPGRGRGQSGSGFQRRGRSSGQGRGSGLKPKTKKLKKPDDALEEFWDHIYIVYQTGQADKTVKTTNVIFNHIKKIYKHGDNLKKAIRDGKDVDFTKLEPVLLTGVTSIDTTTLIGFRYKLQIESLNKRMIIYDTNKTNAHGLAYGQCTQALKSKLQNRKDWNVIQEGLFKLVKAIKDVMHNYQDNRYYLGTIVKSMCNFFMVKQQEGESMHDYGTRLKIAFDIMETRIGKLKLKNVMQQQDDYQSMNATAKAKMEANAYDRLVAYQFLKESSPEKSITLKKDLQNDKAKGDDKYPKTLETAIELLGNYRTNNSNFTKPKQCNQQQNRQQDQAACKSVGFAIVPGDDRREFPHIKCHKCQNFGHYANHYPKETMTNI